MHVRRYGTSGSWVIVVHGGPGAPGHMAPVARGLADLFRILEPWQCSSGDEPLTVAHHVADLYDLATEYCSGKRPALVGSSWGAMLALAFAAAHPHLAGPLVLIGCGTFDQQSRAQLQEEIDRRLGDSLRQRLDQVVDAADADQQMAELGRLLLPLYSHDLVSSEGFDGDCDARAYHESWQDMLRLQDEGLYPAALAAITTPVLMLHGSDDPHPGEMIRASLEPYLPQLEYRMWQRCGHYPWLERAVRDEFFAVLRQWLTDRLTEGCGTGR